jgi:formate transporter
MAENLYLQPKEVAQALSQIGKKKASASVYELFFYGILAGIYISFGGAVATMVLSGGTLDPGLAKLLAGSVFSVGLMLVLIPGAELFTGNILMSIGILNGEYSVYRMLRNWLIVYLGNFAGSLLMAWLVLQSGLLGTDLALSAAGTVAVKIADAKLALTFVQALSRGVLCNMLVCLAVIICVTSRTISGKILGIYFPIMVFVASGYEHSIANMYFLPAGLLAGGQFLPRFFQMFSNLIPVTIGNIIGGLLIVLVHPKELGKIFGKRRPVT